MSYNDFEKTPHSGEPAQLYEIKIGSTTYRHTSAELVLLPGGITYTPERISDSGIGQSGEEAANEVTITINHDHPVAKYLLEFIPTIEIAVKILDFQRPDTDEQVLPAWSGVVINWALRNEDFELVCKPDDYEIGDKAALAPSFGPDCQWTQYDGNCGLLTSGFMRSGTVLSVNGLVITTSANLSAEDPEHYRGGMVMINGEFGVERAWIIVQAGESLTLDRRLPGMAGGINIDVVASCRGLFSRCDTVFNNRLKFLGAPFAEVVNAYRGDGIAGDK